MSRKVCNFAPSFHLKLARVRGWATREHDIGKTLQKNVLSAASRISQIRNLLHDKAISNVHFGVVYTCVHWSAWASGIAYPQ